MGTVIVSSKYQIVIPQDVRKRVGLKQRQKVVVIEKEGVIHLIPQKSIRAMRGFLKGIDTNQLRDEDERF